MSTFHIEGHITIEAESREEAHKHLDSLLNVGADAVEVEALRLVESQPQLQGYRVKDIIEESED